MGRKSAFLSLFSASSVESIIAKQCSPAATVLLYMRQHQRARVRVLSASRHQFVNGILCKIWSICIHCQVCTIASVANDAIQLLSLSSVVETLQYVLQAQVLVTQIEVFASFC